MNVYVRELACQLAKLDLPVDIFTRRIDPETPEPSRSAQASTSSPSPPARQRRSTRTPSSRCSPDFASQAALYSLRQGVRYDVIHAHYWLSGWAAHLLKRYWDAPLLLMFHTTAHMKNAVAAAADLETPLRLDKERQLIDLADGLVAANPDERADLIWRQRLPTDKVCAVPPGVDLDVFAPATRPNPGRISNLPADANVVLFVGRIDPIKGIDTLLDASQASRERHRRTCGPRRRRSGRRRQPVGALGGVAEDAQAAGIRDRIRFAGPVPHHDLPVYYRAADVVTVPSRYESFGLTAVEAMGCGTPVVASRAGGLRFTIDEEESGLLVPHSDPDALARPSSVSSRTKTSRRGWERGRWRRQTALPGQPSRRPSSTSTNGSPKVTGQTSAATRRSSPSAGRPPRSPCAATNSPIRLQPDGAVRFRRGVEVGC